MTTVPDTTSAAATAAAPPISAAQRRELRGRAHALKPLVQIGHDGLSAGVVNETDRALAAHELIKVRILDEAREDRDAMLAALCAATGAAAVQHIGKTLVLWRPKPAGETAPAAPKRRVASPRVPGSRRNAAETPKRRGGSLDTRSRARQLAGGRKKTPRGGSSQGR
ncbi:MAG: ribosome assembly RNA-binding protein YhbY [Rhodocyclaceae bacterium]|nr:ribosome assembly RNA-binding protein YhbY [Rhodocyclaceae bacterium]